MILLNTQSKALPLSVCHVISGDTWAGAEVQAEGLIRGLGKRQDLRMSAIVLNEGRLANELRETGVAVCVIPENSNSFLQILGKARRFVNSQRVQIMHSHRYKENLLALLLAKMCGAPVTIRTQHGLPEPFKGLKAARQTALLWLDRFCGRRWCDAVISVSAEMMPELQRIYGPHPILVRNGIDTTRVRSALSREEAKRKLQIPEAVPLIGIVGRLEPIKRIDLFLQSSQVLAQQFPSAQFLIVGTGSMEEDLKLQAKSLGMADRVHFLGHRSDIYDVLRALDVFVMCSDHEGLPMVLLEALWLGVPAVGRSVGGIKEVLGSDRCGITVSSSQPEEIAEACRRLLEDRALCKLLQRAGLNRIEEEFSIEQGVEEVARHYRRLVNLGRSDLE